MATMGGGDARSMTEGARKGKGTSRSYCAAGVQTWRGCLRLRDAEDVIGLC